MAKFKVGYFLEDNAQDAIIPPLARRIIREGGVADSDIEENSLCTKGGVSLQELKGHLKHVEDIGAHKADVFIVGSDGNCKGFAEKRKQVTEMVGQRFVRCVVAVPDPHVERWLFADPGAFSACVGSKVDLMAPRDKCDKNYYKTLLADSLRRVGVMAPLGGIEYGREYVERLDIYSACKAERSLKAFVDELRNAVADIRSG